MSITVNTMKKYIYTSETRALNLRLSDWCCSVSMVRVQIPSKEEQKFDSSKNLILTLFGLIFRRIYVFFHSIYCYAHIMWRATKGSTLPTFCTTTLVRKTRGKPAYAHAITSGSTTANTTL
jgi:hypothetical protein